MTNLDHTRKTAIVMSFLVMNLERWLKAVFTVSMAAVFRSVFARIQEKLRQPKRLPLLYMGLFTHTGLFRNPYVNINQKYGIERLILSAMETYA
jgi:hypothetical protein